MMDAIKIFDVMNDLFFSMTKAEKRVAAYVLENRQDSQYMSISELAVASQVAEATITRFCRKLGLKGFNAFKLALATASVDRGFAGQGGASSPEQPDTEDDSWQALANRLYHDDMSALNQTLNFIDEKALNRAVDVLSHATHIYCMGQGGSLVLAQEAYSLFLTITPKISFVADSHLQVMTTALLGSRDVILYFSYSGATHDLMELLQMSESRDYTIILVSRFPNSPGAKHSDIVLQCGSNESALRSGSVAARIAQLFVIELLYEGYIRRNPEENQQRREQSLEALMTKLM